MQLVLKKEYQNELCFYWLQICQSLPSPQGKEEKERQEA